MTKILVILFFIVSSFCFEPKSFGDINPGSPSRCVHKIVLNSATSADSSFDARMEHEGSAFARINNSEINFYTDIDTMRFHLYRATFTKATACVSDDLLLIGENSIDISILWPGDESTIKYMTGSANASFLFDDSQLCSMIFYAGNGNRQSCAVRKVLSLAQIAPEKYKEIQASTQRINSQKSELSDRLANYLEMQKKYETLKGCYAKLAEIPLADMPLDNCGENDVETTLINIKKNMDILRVEIDNLKEAAQKKYQQITELVKNELSGMGANSNDLGSYKELLVDIKIPDLILPPLLDTPKYDSTNDVYKNYASKVIFNLEKAMNDDDRLGFLLVADSWLENSSTTLNIIIDRAILVEGEFEAFAFASKEVDVTLEKYLDLSSLKEGMVWFKNSPVPNTLKNTIINDIAPKNPSLARELSRSLVLWRGLELTKEQVAFVTLMEVAGKAIANLPSTVVSIDQALGRKIESIVSSAKVMAITIGKGAVGFSPGGDYIDFCEMATGWEFCNPNGEKLPIMSRALSGAGLIIGSGTVWRTIAAEAKLIKNAEKIETVVQEIEKITDSAGKIGAKTSEEFKQFAGTLKKHKLDAPHFPEGIGFRADLKQHLNSFDGFTQKAGIKGAHNSEAFTKAITDNGARITKTTEHTAVPGVKVVEYEIPKLDSALKPTGEFKGGFKKTVYDPKVISDTEILQLGQIATAQGYEKAIAQGARSYVEKVGGIDFQVFLDGGAVSNVFPIIEGIL